MVTLTQPIERWHNVRPSSCVILIVDDSEVDRATCRRYLESSNNLGCDILECESAEGALQLCHRGWPDAILLDYLLPDGDGLKLLQELAEQLGTLPPVIMLTGQGSEAVAVEAMKHGARDYLIKGQLTPQKLINSVAHALTEQKLQVQLDRQRQQRELLTSIALKISYSVELPQILQAAVEGARELLGCDRTMVYRLGPHMSGTIVAESVLPGWSAVLGRRFEDNCFQGKHTYQIEKYRQGHKMVVSNIESANLTACHINMLKQFQVKANLVVPILLREVSPSSEPSVWGLLIAHHCQAVHEWKADELSLVDELSIQLSIAIQKAELVGDLKAILEKRQAIEYQLRDRVEEIEQTNVRLSQATHLLEKRNQELDEFANIASHDLKAPLRGIVNLAEWLIEDLNGQLSSENQHQLELIQSRVLQMDTLINGLLQYARVGKENVEPTSVNISQLLEEVVDLLAPPTGFQIQFPSNLPTLETRALLLKQVFSNLIDNAIKYHTSPGKTLLVPSVVEVRERTNGKVEILVKDQESFWQFMVVDNGPGVAPEHHQKIFGMFQTLVKSSDATKETGIGLAIVKKIVESQGGSIWVESELGQGSTFSFTWPKTL
jgi:signal transduction histidine kinase/CheY-like chemotaxis protein